MESECINKRKQLRFIHINTRLYEQEKVTRRILKHRRLD